MFLSFLFNKDISQTRASQAIKMKRAATVGVNQPLAVTTSAIPSEAPPKGLLIKVLATGVCHTDLHFIQDEVPLGDGKFWRHRDVMGDDYIGTVPGHEIAGSVMRIGKEVGKECPFKIGDEVIVFPWRGCRDCDMCDDEKSNYCEHNKSTTTDVGKGLDGRKDGGFQSHFPLPEWQNAVKLPKSISPEIGCMLPCSGLTTYSALGKAGESLELGIKLRNRANLLFIGAGGLGVWAVVNARAIYGEKVRITCADISADKLSMIKELGADETVLFSRDASVDDMVASITNNGCNKMDAAIDHVGSPHTLKAAFFALHNGGTLVPIGLAGGSLQLPTPTVIGRSIAIKGNRTGSLSQLKELTELFSKHGFPTLPAVEYFNFDEINTVLDKLRKGQIAGRAILKFD